MLSLSHPSILSIHQSILFCKLQMPKHCCCSVTQSCLTLCDPTDCSMPGSLSLTISQSLPKFMFIALVIQSHPLKPSSPFPASGTFPMSCLLALDDQNTAVSVSTSVLPMNIQGWSPLRLIGLISFAVQGTFRSLLQHHSLKASILWCSAFFTVQLSP